MRFRLCLLLFIGFAVAAGVNAQDCPHPSGCVTISREAAVKALQDSDAVKAQAAEIIVKDKAIDDLKKEVVRMQIELAKTVGELTGSQQMNVRQTAIIDVLVKKVGKKCSPLSILCL